MVLIVAGVALVRTRVRLHNQGDDHDGERGSLPQSVKSGGLDGDVRLVMAQRVAAQQTV